jgi:hypothetical protein
MHWLEWGRWRLTPWPAETWRPGLTPPAALFGRVGPPRPRWYRLFESLGLCSLGVAVQQVPGRSRAPSPGYSPPRPAEDA